MIFEKKPKVVVYVVNSTSTTTHPPLPPPHPHQGKTKFNVHCQGNLFIWSTRYVHATIMCDTLIAKKNPSCRKFSQQALYSFQCSLCHTNNPDDFNQWESIINIININQYQSIVINWLILKINKNQSCNVEWFSIFIDFHWLSLIVIDFYWKFRSGFFIVFNKSHG